jgi:hypothetical protein
MPCRVPARFAWKYQRPLEDVQAQAYLLFLEAYHGFRVDVGTSLEQRVRFVVWNRLLDTVGDSRQ